MKITDWGAKVQQILVPARNGVLGDVALGYDSIDQLQAGQASMGAFVGRYANRIGQAKFTLDGQEYKLAASNGPNTLHRNFLEGKQPRDVGKGGAVYAFRAAFCLEPSHFPDSPNKPQFPSTVLNPGEWYSGKTVDKFSVRK